MVFTPYPAHLSLGEHNRGLRRWCKWFNVSKQLNLRICGSFYLIRIRGTLFWSRANSILHWRAKSFTLPALWPYPEPWNSLPVLKCAYSVYTLVFQFLLLEEWLYSDRSLLSENMESQLELLVFQYLTQCRLLGTSTSQSITCMFGDALLWM